MRKTLQIILLIFWVTTACKGPEGFQSSNVAYLYNPNELAIKSHLVVQHLSDSISRLHYRLNSSDLLYVRNNKKDFYEAQFAISYKVSPSIENTTVLDSNKFSFKDQVDSPPEKVISGYFDFKTPDLPEVKNEEYLLLVEFADLSRGSSYQNFEKVRKENLNSRQFFTLTDTTGEILFKPHVPANVPFRLQHSSLNPQYYYVSVYQRDFPLALPPYSSKNSESFELEPDTTFRINAHENIRLPETGFYHFRLDTSQWRGFTVYSFYQEFPYVARPPQLAEPLRYLTLRSEYEAYEAAAGDPAQVKKWVDEFWLDRAGSIERSKVLVSAFYQRVEHANRQFSSFLEGWKTDRGIVYAIYGPPNKVFRSSSGESWVYGNETSSLSYVFNFIRVDNPFSGNDYQLERRPQYRYGWGQAIEAWRNGHIYNSKDIRREQDAQDQLQYRRQSPVWY